VHDGMKKKHSCVHTHWGNMKMGSNFSYIYWKNFI
jgi:hypothetical protein